MMTLAKRPTTPRRTPRPASRRGKSFFVGIDLGGTNMQIGIVRLDEAGVASVIGRNRSCTQR